MTSIRSDSLDTSLTLDALPMPAATVDGGGRLVSANKALRRLLGRRGALISYSDPFVAQIQSDGIEMQAVDADAAIRDADVYGQPVRMVSHIGRIVTGSAESWNVRRIECVVEPRYAGNIDGRVVE